jgi:poly-gamma-glutamate synthesis protein (capsule biosynthesis protein)
MRLFFLRVQFLLCFIFWHKKFSASRTIEGNTFELQKGEWFWWRYKYFFKQIEEGEWDGGVEAYLQNQSWDFSPPPDFIAEKEARITAGGDILPTFDLRSDTTAHLWDDVADFYFDADVVYANLESPIDKTHPLSPPNKNVFSPPAMNSNLENFDLYFRSGKGITCFSTANNHSLDQGVSGLLATLDFLDEKKAFHFGTARSPEDRDDIQVLVLQGIRVAFLSYTYSLNKKKPPEGQEYLSNSLRLNKPGVDISLIKEHIRIARQEKNADLVVAALHWGIEFESFPQKHGVDLGHTLIEAGIDIIIGNHPHGLQGAECYVHTDSVTGIVKKGLILYSLGDLIAGLMPTANETIGALARITIQKGYCRTMPCTLISGVELKPIYKYRLYRKNTCKDFRILDLYDYAEQVANKTVRIPLDKKRAEIARLQHLSKRILG